MAIQMVPISRIRDNPFQSRQDYDDIESLALNIASRLKDLPGTLGLIHPPNARLMYDDSRVIGEPKALPEDDPKWTVELAEGHRRLRAFRLLAEGDAEAGLQADEQYREMPVNLVGLDDQAMDDIAWDENTARKDLSPVEEAQALQRTMERFNLSQVDLGERRHLARSTVANKLRLLQLPADLLDAVHSGHLSERHGIAYLPILEIKPDDLNLVEIKLATNVDFYVAGHYGPTPEVLRRRLIEMDDLTADDVRKIVDNLKYRIDEAKKRQWEAGQAAPSEIPVAGQADQADRGPEPPATPSAPRASKAGSSTVGTSETPSKPPPVMAPTPAAPHQKLEMPPKEDLAPDLPDVIITIRLKQDRDEVATEFTLSIGEEGDFPKLYKGDYTRLANTVGQACHELFRPAAQTEQILIETEA